MEYIIKQIRKYLNISQSDFAEMLGISFATINRWENGKAKPSKMAEDKLIEICKREDIPAFDFIIDKIKSEVASLDIPFDRIVLYHGSKSGIIGEIKPQSRSQCDFGKGFYMGSIPEQPLTLICNFIDSKFYVLSFPKKASNIMTCNDDLEWAMFIAFNRGKMNSAVGTGIYDKYSSLSNNIDVMIGNIVNDKMYQVLDDFFEETITDAALISCLSALKLGTQYVCITDKACADIKIEKEIPLSYMEKEIIKITSNKYRSEGRKLADDIYKKHRREGKYFDEILNEE